MDNKNIKYVIIVVIMMGIFTAAYFVLTSLNKDEGTIPFNYLKNYGVNEYIQTYVSDQDIAKLYLNDYINKMLYNTEEAYNNLDEEYRNEKFGSYENYYNYVLNLGSYNIKMAKYYKDLSKGGTIYGVYDQNDNLYIFRTSGVMQYKLYLDDYTVGIR